MSRRRIVVLLALAPSTLGAQSLARQIARVGDGTVRFTYAARPGLCGDGRETIRSGSSIVVLPNMFGYGRSDMDVCFAGPVRVSIGRSNGQTVSYRVHVGGRWSAGDDATDLGVVSAPDAARYLLTEATHANGRNAIYAMAGAVFADSIDLVPDLSRIARDADLATDLRERAVYWIATDDDESSIRAVRQLAADEQLDESVRGAAIIALGRDDISDDDVAWLRRLYPNLSPKLRDNVFLAVSRSDSPRASRWLSDVASNANETEHTREQAMFWLGQGRSPTEDLVRLYDHLPEAALRSHYTFVLSQRRDREALDKLIDVAQHDTNRDVRHQALFWLGQSKDPGALAFIRDLVTR
ncbi:MAG TPA: HEAT repeat domain-containing protein [Gemmatimonadaceae bacterium]